AKDAEEGDQESLISSESTVIEALTVPPQPEDTVQDTVITPPISPFKETAPVEDSGLSPEIDIHGLNIPSVLYLEAPPTIQPTSPVSAILQAEIPTTPILNLEPEDQNLEIEAPESPSVTHTLVLSEDYEILSSSGDSASASAPVSITFHFYTFRNINKIF
ncbi:MAG: hypothetical protein Q8829_02965, partial [Candidatus Phytoplasma australasiaticum]|nr:hypothetical protein [Candidatus Phytoplasma australasiaticum]